MMKSEESYLKQIIEITHWNASLKNLRYSFNFIFVCVSFDILLYDVNGADGKSSDWDQPGPEAGAPGDTPELE